MAVPRRWLAVAAAVFVATAAACGADGNADTSATTTTSSQSGTTAESSTTTTGGGDSEITEEQLTEALLTVDDLPSGFEASSNEDEESDADDDEDLKADDPGCQHALDALDAATDDEDDGITALATFQRDEVEEVEHELKAVPDAADRIERVRATLEEDCGNRVEFGTDDSGSGVLEVVDGAQHGDGTFYVKMSVTATEDGTELEATAIVVYGANAGVGSRISLATVDIPSMSVDADEPTMEDAERLAATAQERYDDVFG